MKNLTKSFGKDEAHVCGPLETFYHIKLMSWSRRIEKLQWTCAHGLGAGDHHVSEYFINNKQHKRRNKNEHSIYKAKPSLPSNV